LATHQRRINPDWRVVNDYEVVLPRRVVPQPNPGIVPGGDCVPCVLAGLLNISVRDVYEKLNEGKYEPLGGSSTRSAFYEAKSLGWIDRLIDEAPYWPSYHRMWGDPSWLVRLPWIRYMQMVFDAGYYGVASINLDGKGPIVENDHGVLFCGIRQRTVSHPTLKAASSIEYDLLVSCSARHPEGKWYEYIDYLEKYGGFNCFLARPK
jgi:hypothetical protein